MYISLLNWSGRALTAPAPSRSPRPGSGESLVTEMTRRLDPVEGGLIVMSCAQRQEELRSHPGAGVDIE